MSKRLIAVVVAASIVLAGIWYVALWSPQSRSLSKANADVAAAEQKQQGLQSEISTLQQQKVQLPEKQATLTALKLALPDLPALDKLFDDINTAANQTGVDWQSISPAKPASFAAGTAQAAGAGFPGGMQAVNLTLQVNGSYSQILDFVTKLNGIPRLLDVVSFNVNGVGLPVTKTTAQINAQIFYVPAAPGSVRVTTTTTVTK